jgi:hypothetical protein
MKLILCSILICFALVSVAQKQVYLHIQPKFNGQNLQLQTDYSAWNGKKIKLDHFDYYVSDVSIFHNGEVVEFPDHIFLAEPYNFTFYIGNLNLQQIDSIRFTVGVPKPYNIQSGSKAQDISLYPDSHPLSFQSPTMYWGWQFGYMHMIIGGWGENENLGIADSYFELHNLGNSNQQFVNVVVPSSAFGENQLDVFIDCNVDRWIKNIEFQTIGVAHGELGVNRTILQNAVNEQVFTADALASTSKLTDEKFKFWLTKNILNVQVSKTPSKIELLDLQGRVLVSEKISEKNFQLSTQKFPSGVYVIKWSEGNLVQTSKIFIP